MFQFSVTFLHLFLTCDRLLLFNSMAERGLQFRFYFVSSKDYVVRHTCFPLLTQSFFGDFGNLIF